MMGGPWKDQRFTLRNGIGIIRQHVPKGRLARNGHGGYIQRQIAAMNGGFLFRSVPNRCHGKMVEVPNPLKRLG